MPRDRADVSYPWEMLEYTRALQCFVLGKRYHDYLSDRQLRLAVERRIEVVGEAARNVSDEFLRAHPAIPWRKIIAQRHVLAHEHGEPRHDRIWRVATESVPPRISQLEPLVRRAPES